MHGEAVRPGPPSGVMTKTSAYARLRSVAHLLRVDETNSTICQPVTMTSKGLTETQHLEAWITQNPSVIDNTLMVVTTQFNSWASEQGSARERPDILALSTSGELVVIELKRDSDRKIHLQAITYGALVAGFTKQLLAEAHAEWVRKDSGEELSPSEALERLNDHVDTELSEDSFRLPRLILVAEAFPSQVLTTVQWLATTAPAIVIECHEYQLFEQVGGTVASFQKIVPVNDLGDQLLRPIISASAAEVREQIATSKRRAKSVTIIHDNSLIPSGAALTLDLAGLVRPEAIPTVMNWLDEDPARSDVTWIADPVRPLRWGLDASKTWTPSSLRNEIFERAGAGPAKFSAADAWNFNGMSLYNLAESISTET